MSFTGSTRAGVELRRTPPRPWRVAQELGGKSANIVLSSANVAGSSAATSSGCANSGQSCNAGTRILVPNDRMDEAAAAAAAAGSIAWVTPRAMVLSWGRSSPGAMGQGAGSIAAGMEEGATLAGRPGRPGPGKYFVKPTVFANVTNDMTSRRGDLRPGGFDQRPTPLMKP